jgi:3-oxoacyl-[acyl-carrier-protein] synthase II
MRLAVTGIGMVTPLGATRDETWAGVRSGASALRGLPAGLFPGAQGFAGELPPLADLAPCGERAAQYAVRAAAEAAAEAAILGVHDPERIGCFIGSSKGGMPSLAAFAADSGDASTRRFFEFCPCAPAAARCLGLAGPVMAEAASCATGVACLARAAAHVAEGRCDAALAGSADASLTPVLLAGFATAGVLSRHPDPGRACRPFDRGRDGFLIGEGAAVFCIEPIAAARRCRAFVYAVLAAAVLGSEAFHQTRPSLWPCATGSVQARGSVRPSR